MIVTYTATYWVRGFGQVSITTDLNGRNWVTDLRRKGR